MEAGVFQNGAWIEENEVLEGIENSVGTGTHKREHFGRYRQLEMRRIWVPKSLKIYSKNQQKNGLQKDEEHEWPRVQKVAPMEPKESPKQDRTHSKIQTRNETESWGNNEDFGKAKYAL